MVRHAHPHIDRLELLSDVQATHELLNRHRRLILDSVGYLVLQLPPPEDLPLALQFFRRRMLASLHPAIHQVNVETPPGLLDLLRSIMHSQISLHLIHNCL